MTTKPASKSSKNKIAMPVKITPQSEEAQSANLVANNIEQLKALFPEACAEGKIDFEVLRQLLGDNVDEREERFGLNWHGKRRARQLALQPSLGTLRPSKDDSVDWDTTKNLMIEGDNLEVLKLLQRSYAGKVKLIYIDPPYNTGNDFVYPDDFRDNIKNYLELTGQVESGRKLSTNTETSGRFHTDWLNMMYPRLKLAKELLRDDGAIFISIDDGEASHLRTMLDEIFGGENFIAQFIWKARQFTDARAVTNVSTDHEYILAYAKDAAFALRGVERDESKFSNDDNDPRGPWMSRSILGLATRDQRPNLHYDIVDPVTGRSFPPNPATGWRYSQDKLLGLIKDQSILFPKKDDGRPREKKFRKDMLAEFIAYRSIIDDVHTADGTAEIRQLFGSDVFDFPKPTGLIRQLVQQVALAEDIVLDFFAGSGTTANAVWEQVVSENIVRRWILVQLPQAISTTDRNQKEAADFCTTIGRPNAVAELTKERLRRAAKKIKEENPMYAGDLGFRVFKLDSSNINTWDPATDDLEKTLYSAVSNLKEDRTEEDLLFEMLLKLGLELTVPVETKKVGKLKLHSVGQGALIACLAPKLAATSIEEIGEGIIAWHQALAPAVDSTVILRDSAFPDDVTKANLTAILQQYEPANGHKLIVRSL